MDLERQGQMDPATGLKSSDIQCSTQLIVLFTDLTKYYLPLTIETFTNHIFSFIIPTITMLVTYGTYTLIMKESLNGL